MTADKLRLGHALRGGTEAVKEAIEILTGSRSLTARPPVDPAAVEATERALGIESNHRPVYAYVGDLNPALGTLGLIVQRAWDQAAIGVTRCDSGGLGGRRGAFAILKEDEALSVLAKLSYSGAKLASWAADFSSEVRSSYSSERAYVDGAEPEISHWSADVRARCIQRAEKPADRRLWTWEVRLDRGPLPQEAIGLVMSAGAYKVFVDEVEHDNRVAFPEEVHVIPGQIGPEGAHFHLARTRALLAGDA